MISEMRSPFGPASEGRISQGPKLRQHKRNARTDHPQPTNFAAFFAVKVAGFLRRRETSAAEAEPVNEVEDVSLVLGAID